MRDILLAALIFGLLPWVLRRPNVGILVWSWLAYMNPHRMTWGFAYHMPFSTIVAIVFCIGFVFNKEPKQFPVNHITVIWLCFLFWMLVTTAFAIHYDEAIIELAESLKIQLFTMLTMIVMKGRERINQLVWVIVVSIGFFGVKGGLFTIATAGSARVWGPPDSFIHGNNELALALVMIFPLMRYLSVQAENIWIKRGLMLAMLLSGFSILASYSRGALLALTSMLVLLLYKSKNRLGLILLIAVAVLAIVPNLPVQWLSRMGTIKTYEEDGSAMGRINAWKFALNLTSDRPVLGGGFETFSQELFDIYAPNPDVLQDAHSIYFQVLGEHGYPGLVMFIMLWLLCVNMGNRIIRMSKHSADAEWAGNLASMLQVSIVGYCVGGTFLGLAYFDLPYHIMALLVLTQLALRKQNELPSAGNNAEQGWQGRSMPGAGSP